MKISATVKELFNKVKTGSLKLKYENIEHLNDKLFANKRQKSDDQFSFLPLFA